MKLHPKCSRLLPAARHGAGPCHLANRTAVVDAPAARQQRASAEPSRLPGPGRAPEQNSERKDFCKNGKLLLPTKASFGNYLPLFKFSCLHLLFSGWCNAMAPVTLRADTFSTAESTKEAEILSITWR